MPLTCVSSSTEACLTPWNVPEMQPKRLMNVKSRNAILLRALHKPLNHKRILKMAKLSVFTKNNLNKQGFCKLNDEEKSRYALALRFTPAVATILIVIGLVLRSPIWIWSMALVALSGALFPNGMVLDLVYNMVVRHLFHAPRLPSTPTPRRFSYILSTVFLSGSALSFYYGLSWLGFILGGMVVIGSTTLTITLWCLGSWYYRLFFGHKGTE